MLPTSPTSNALYEAHTTKPLKQNIERLIKTLPANQLNE